MVLAAHLRVPAAGVLELVRLGVAAEGVEGAVERDAEGADPDRAADARR